MEVRKRADDGGNIGLDGDDFDDGGGGRDKSHGPALHERRATQSYD